MRNGISEPIDGTIPAPAESAAFLFAWSPAFQPVWAVGPASPSPVICTVEDDRAGPLGHRLRLIADFVTPTLMD